MFTVMSEPVIYVRKPVKRSAFARNFEICDFYYGFLITSRLQDVYKVNLGIYCKALLWLL
jgi:hypothetical protein